MYWIVGVVILCLIILMWQMTIIGKPIKWKERSNDIKNLTETDEEIRDAEARIQELKAERVKLQRLKTLNNRKFKVCGDVIKLRKEIERIGENRFGSTDNPKQRAKEAEQFFSGMHGGW